MTAQPSTAPSAGPPSDPADLRRLVAAPGSSAAARRQELGAFLRSRREGILPDQVGLPAGGRRRTPGLRREEVAALAGVGVTWYTWLEQGRDIHVSDEVLEAISRTLQFDRHERRHLFALAGSGSHEAMKECQALSPAVQVILDSLDPNPACVLNARFDILAFNRAYCYLVDDVSALPFEDRNTLWLNLTHPAWRESVVDRDGAIGSCIATLRSSMADHVADPAWKAFIRRLADASPEFVERWERQEVRAPENRVKSVLNPVVGALRFDYTNLWLGPNLGTRLVTYTPADDETRARLDLLATSAPAAAAPAAAAPLVPAAAAAAAPAAAAPAAAAPAAAPR